MIVPAGEEYPLEIKLRERLNLGEEQNVEDAIKDKIEEEAKRSLLKLLGRD